MSTKRASFRCQRDHQWMVVLDSGATLADEPCPDCGLMTPSGLVQYEPVGGWPEPARDDAPYFFVKDRPYEVRPECRVLPQGRHYGVSDKKHNERYRRTLTRFANEAKAFRSGHSKKKLETPEYSGAMPGELVRAIGIQERDPEAVAKDPVGWLKKTGYYVGS